MNANSIKAGRSRSCVKPVVVQGLGFRCMAYRGKDGKLRDFWTQRLLPVPIHVLDPEN